jgi:hypothetical protein
MKPARVAAARPRVARPEHSLQWLAEPLLDEPTFELKSWFGGRTLRLHGRHTLFLTTQGEPWQGVLVCTFHEHQSSLMAEFPALRPHPILKKWLYLPESVAIFEADARRLVRLVRARDPRIGIEPSARKKKKTAAARPIRFGDPL